MMLSVTQLAPVWVVEKASGRDPGPAYVLASRLGCLFRRVSMDDLILDSHLEGRRAPGLILTSGVRGGYAALRAGRRAQCPVVWCMKGETRSASMLRSLPFDLVVASSSATVAPKFCPTLGPLTAVSPHVLAHAGRAWQERLEHLPHPRIAVNLGDGAFRTPEEALLLGKKLALMVNRYGGSVLLSVREDTHPELTDAFIVGLSASFILVWRTGEPDEDPTLGFMACADTVVVLGGNAVALVEACAVDVPVFLMEREQDLRGARGRLVRRLIEDHHLRLLEDDFVAWPRPILDEAGRIADVMKARWAL